MIYISPNFLELKAIAKALDETIDGDEDGINDIKKLPKNILLEKCALYSRIILDKYFENIIITLGSKGVCLVKKLNSSINASDQVGSIQVRFFFFLTVPDSFLCSLPSR